MKKKSYRDAFFIAHNIDSLSAQIATIRCERNLSQADLAVMSNTPESTIALLEDPTFDDVQLSTLQRIASALDVALNVNLVTFSTVAIEACNRQNSHFSVMDFARDTINTVAQSSIRFAEVPSFAVATNLREDTYTLPSFSGLKLRVTYAGDADGIVSYAIPGDVAGQFYVQ